MREWVDWIAEWVILVIDAMALAVIAIGTLEAFVAGARTLIGKDGGKLWKRDVWLRYGRWLVVGLTFQLAADIIETSVAASWQDLGRLAAIAAIRTFLNYFLERDLRDVRAEERELAKA
jgi:uncharacterized membrane protein